jgi:serine protease
LPNTPHRKTQFFLYLANKANRLQASEFIKRQPPMFGAHKELNMNAENKTQKQKPSKQSASKENDHVQRVIVKFIDGVKLPYAAGVEKAIAERKLGPVEDLMRLFPKSRFVPLFASITPQRIIGLVRRAVALDPKYNPPDFLSYFAVETAVGADWDALAKYLMNWDSVEYAYVAPRESLPAHRPYTELVYPESPPMPDPQDDPLFEDQGYLKPAPEGIGAQLAWPVRGGGGNGVKLFDIEHAWKIDIDLTTRTGVTLHIDAHEDLPAHRINLLSGFIDRFESDHGTGVLGVIAAVDNDIGCIGIAPHVSEIGLISTRRTPVTEPAVHSSPDAIMDALTNMDFGDVLLLELQINFLGIDYVPTELDPATFEAIRLATTCGIVVVEAAGNGGVDLDELKVPFTKRPTNICREPLESDLDSNLAVLLGNRPLNRFNPSFRDSGAIVVGAGSSSPPRTRMDFSCYGSRIDCHAWGEKVQTLGATPDGRRDTYVDDFNGTSSASAIIAGIVVATQAMALEHLRRALSPQEMRDIIVEPLDILDNSMRPTPSADPENDRIGVMPNLASIVIHLGNRMRFES